MGANLTVLADIKDLALKTETLEIEKRGKSNTPNLMVNPVEENQDVDALYQGQRYRGTNRGCFKGGSGSSIGRCGGYNGGDRGGFRRDRNSGQTSHNRGDNNQNYNNTQTKPQNQQAPAPYKGSANGEEQPLLDSRARQESGVQIVAKSRTTQLNVGGNKKKTVNDVNDEEDEQPQNEQEDTPHCDTIQSFFQAKN
jgi:hypothetical protein